MIGHVRIVNQRYNSEVKADPDEVVIDITRTTRSPLQNRHPMREHSMAERNRVIALNLDDMEADMAVDGPMYQEMKRIAGIVASGQDVALQCYCAPSPCHGDHYVPVILAMAKRMEVVPVEDAGPALA